MWLGVVFEFLVGGTLLEVELSAQDKRRVAWDYDWGIYFERVFFCELAHMLEY
jgi:hypothetical protein